MKKINKIAITLAALLAIFTTSAQSDSKKIEALEATVEELTRKFEAAEATKIEEAKSAAQTKLYTPTVFGSILAYYNVSGYTGDQRFAVRNAHLGVKGNASKEVSYQIQVNFNNLGSVSVLDSWIMYKSGRFNATLGQQFVHLTADFDRCGPKLNIFPTRSYGVLYITGYTNGTTVKTLGNRDIGLYTNYTLGENIPVTLSLAAFNGAGANQVTWNNDINLMGRIQIGGTKGLSGGGSVYGGRTPYLQEIMIYSAEVRYVTSDLFIEANYQNQQLQDNGASSYEGISTGLIEAYYTFGLPSCKTFESVAPCIRYDFAKNFNYSNVNNGIIEKLDANRLTTQLSFMLPEAKVRSRLSIGYEKVLMADKPSDIGDNTLFQDKFIAGLTVAF